MIELRLGDIQALPEFEVTALTLKEIGGSRVLPVWVTPAAITDILLARVVDHEAPTQLPASLVPSWQHGTPDVTALHIKAADEGVYDTQIMLDNTAVPCRLSLGLALALRRGAPIMVAEDVLEAWHVAGLDPDADVPSESDELDQFQAFLASVNPDDFGREP